MFYSPFLVQSRYASTARHYRRIPRNPKAEHRQPMLLLNDVDEQCKIRDLNIDPSQSFFKIDWSVYFSAHTLRRAALAENSPLSGTSSSGDTVAHQVLEYGKESERELAAYADYDSEIRFKSNGKAITTAWADR